MEPDVSNKANINNQADAVIYFFQRLDIDMVSDILEDNRTYQDFVKPLFVHKLGNAFDEFIKAGDTFLPCHSGFCNSKLCNYKCKGYSFIGNHSGNYLDMIIEIKDGVGQDMYGYSECKMQVKCLKKHERIVLKIGLNDWQVKALMYVV